MHHPEVPQFLILIDLSGSEHAPTLFFFCTQIVENCICTLRNLSYRLELEMAPSRLIGGQEVDGLLDSESANKEEDSSCWGRKKKKKKKSSQEDSVSEQIAKG